MDIGRYESMFPPAHILAENNAVDPRINDVMIEETREEMQDRRGRANFLARADVEEAKRAQNYALITSLILGVGAIGTIFKGHDAAGGAVATGVLVSLAIAFLGGPRRLRQQQKDDPAE